MFGVINMAEDREFTKYERARIIGARGLQIAMDAPLLTKMSEDELNGVNYDPLKIAEKELNSGVLPISVDQPLPPRNEEDIEKIKIEESTVSDEAKIKAEAEEEKDIAESGEMMELTNSEEEKEEDVPVLAAGQEVASEQLE
jgi:DNA-directed RNA polymerase subunit K/omega